jgi:2-amino-4-hydroxy-6-hydroxymethyldihydropteridine diphosphokinase
MHAVIGLGGNLGDRLANLRRAVSALRAHGNLVAASSVYETAPVGPPQPDYLNAAISLETTLTPRALLDALLAIERAMGRVRDVKWGPRTIDLDVLWILGVTIEEDDLIVPHPRLTERAFALLPLLDVAPEATDPKSGVKYASLSISHEGARDTGWRLDD